MVAKSQPKDYSRFKREPAPSELAQLADLARRMFEEEEEVRKADETLKAKKAALRNTAEVAIPELMLKCGIKEFRTATGLHIKVRADVRGNITAENKPAAIAWLDDHGCGGVVKRKIFIDFPREDETRAKQLAEELKRRFSNVGEDYSVHPQTLLALARERLRDGKEFPLSLFGIEQFQKAQIDTKEASAGAG